LGISLGVGVWVLQAKLARNPKFITFLGPLVSFFLVHPQDGFLVVQLRYFPDSLRKGRRELQFLGEFSDFILITLGLETPFFNFGL
jgi:hypothetical protein